MFLTNYKNSLVNLSSSILKRFNVEPFHSTIPSIDELLQKHNKIVVILMDGMNEYLLETHKDVTRPFLDKCFTKITSVYPPTTVAATTSFLTAKYPGETGYLGWSQPINNFTRNVNVFSNRDTQTEELIPGENIINRLCPTQKIYDIINYNFNETEETSEYYKDCVKNIKMAGLSKRQQAIMAKISNCDNEDEKRALRKELQEIIIKMKDK